MKLTNSEHCPTHARVQRARRTLMQTWLSGNSGAALRVATLELLAALEAVSPMEAGTATATPCGIVALVVDLVQSIEDLEEVHDLIGQEVLKATGRA